MVTTPAPVERRRRTRCGVGIAVLAAGAAVAFAVPAAAEHHAEHLTTLGDALDVGAQLAPVRLAAVSLPVAGILAALLAFRPRQRGTPRRTPTVIQTQIILALVGAVVMLVVGTSLARAFGIVGAAGLVRYRAKISDPKDAGVMLSTLAIGLASGVGLYALAAFATFVILGVLWVVESLEPEEQKLFDLKITTKDPTALRPAVEGVLRRTGIHWELRATTAEELCYEVKLPWARRTDRLSNSILELDSSNSTAVVWDEKKNKTQ